MRLAARPGRPPAIALLAARPDIAGPGNAALILALATAPVRRVHGIHSCLKVFLCVTQKLLVGEAGWKGGGRPKFSGSASASSSASLGICGGRGRGCPQ